MFSDWRIRHALEAGAVGVWYWEVDADRIHWSPNFEQLHGRAPGTFEGNFRSFLEDVHPDDRARVKATVAAALSAGGPYELEYRVIGVNHEVRWLEARGQVESIDGARAMTGVCRDVTDRRTIQEELANRLAQQEAVAELGKLALKSLDLQRLFDRSVVLVTQTLALEYANVLELLPGGEQLLLRSGIGWREGLVGNATVSTGPDGQAGYTLRSGEPVLVEDLARESRFRGQPILHEHGVVSGITIVIAGPDGMAFGVFGAHTKRHRRFTQYDVNFLLSVANVLGSAIQRAHAEEVRVLLFNELRHRVGNLFSQILSVHRQTARTSKSVAELSEKFEGRLMATADAHQLISARGWSTTSLRELFQTVLRPYVDRVTLVGPEVAIAADTAFALSLAINELATNAAKHGCFRGFGGRLLVDWRLSRERPPTLTIVWSEKPARPMDPPGAESFGSRLVERTITRQLQGTLDRRFLPSGLRVLITLPLDPRRGDDVEPITAPASAAAGPTGNAGSALPAEQRDSLNRLA